ncbi:restriction endonuclease subunit S [Vagococcus fluvialis]
MNKQKKEPVIRFNGFTDTWEQRKLGEVSDIIGGGTPSTSNPEFWDGDIDWYAPAEIGQKIFVNNSLKKITELGLEKSSAKILPIGTILFTSRAGIGNTAILSKEGTTNQGFQSIVPKYKILDSYFIFSRTKELKRYGEVTGAGSTFIEVSGKQMAKMLISIPRIEEQIKIGNFFKQLDETITLQEHELLLLKEQKKSLLQKMFPKKGSKVPEMRFAEFTDDWEQHELGDYIIQFNEVTTENNQHPVFTSSRRGLFFQKDYYEGNQIASENNIGYNIVPRGYFTYRHMSDDLVFKFNINNLADYGIVSTLYPVFTTTEKMDSNYLQYHLNEGEEFRRFSILQKQGGSRTYMYLSKLKCLNLTVPIIEEQRMISSFFKQLDDTITLQESKLETLKNMKKSFLQKMFV